MEALLGVIGGGSRRERMVEEFVPNSGWTEDNNFHYLLLDLPGFHKEQVKLQVDDAGNITVTGERILRNGTAVFFHQTFQPLPNSNIDKISGKFDGEILYVTLPKLEAEEESGHDDNDHEEEENYETDENGITEDNPQETQQKHGDEETKVSKEQKREAMEMIKKVMKKNKRILVTAILAFSLGLYIARKFDYAMEATQ